MSALGDGRLYLCETCDRYGPPARDGRTFGRQLADAVLAAAPEACPKLEVRIVPCLNGCMNPCNAALRGHNKITYRFSRLSEADAADVIAFAAAYLDAPDGDVDETPFEGGLADRISVRTPPLRLPTTE